MEPSYLPVLQRGDWGGHGQAYTRPLRRGSGATPHDLWISFAIVEREANSYITRADLASGSFDARALFRSALERLVARPHRGRWQTHRIEDTEFLLRGGDELTSSELLVRPWMRKAHAHYLAERVFVAMPHRFALIASVDPLALAPTVGGMYEDALRQRSGALSPMVFVLEDGSVVGTLDASSKPATPSDDTLPATEEVVLAPLLVFFFVATADGEVERSEFERFERALTEAASKSAGMVRSLLERAISCFESDLGHVANLMQREDPVISLTRLSRTLKERFPVVEREQFGRAMVALARAIAGPAVTEHGASRTESARSEEQALATIELLLHDFPCDRASPPPS